MLTKPAQSVDIDFMEGTLTKAPARPAAPNSGGASATSGSAALRLIKFALALALLPLCYGMTRGVGDVFQSAWTHYRAAQHDLSYWFAAGTGVFALLAAVLWRPVVVYVFGHELVHALATWLCLGSVSNFKASTSGGSITSSKSNTLIRLAPYCVPLYALLAAGIYLGLNVWWRPLHGQLHWAMAALGFFYAFHVGFTVWSMHRDQPDLKPDGWCFSLVVIYLANLTVFALLMGFVFTGNAGYAWPALHSAALRGWQHSTETYQHLATSAHSVYARYAHR